MDCEVHLDQKATPSPINRNRIDGTLSLARLAKEAVLLKNGLGFLFSLLIFFDFIDHERTDVHANATTKTPFRVDGKSLCFQLFQTFNALHHFITSCTLFTSIAPGC